MTPCPPPQELLGKAKDDLQTVVQNLHQTESVIAERQRVFEELTERSMKLDEVCACVPCVRRARARGAAVFATTCPHTRAGPGDRRGRL